MMAVSALMAASNNPNDSAIANGIASPLVHGAEHVGAGDADRYGSDCDGRRQGERGRQHQFDESDRSVLWRRNLTGIRDCGAGE